MKESKSSATIRRRRRPPGELSRTHLRSLSSSSATSPNDDDDDVDDDVDDDEGTLEGPRVLKLILSSEQKLFCGLLAFRCLNALVIQTSYVPDEYWQSVEVSHRMAYGYGFLTWEWRHGLRSYIYPLLFALPYKILHILHLDYRILLIKLPRLMQACLAALGDLYVYKLTRRLTGRGSAQWAVLCQVISWFNFYTSTRTLTNSTEATLTAIALYYYPWPHVKRLAQWKFILSAGLSVIARPTAAVTWLPLTVWLLYRQQHRAYQLIKYIAELGFLVLIVTSMIDRWFYGRWVSVQYNFLQFNVLSDLGHIYGSHPAHWYITQGLPVVLASHLPILLIGLYYNVAPVCLAVIGWSVAVYSALSHKEFRFMLGIMPLMMHICGRTLHMLVKQSQPIRSTDTSQPTNKNPRDKDSDESCIHEGDSDKTDAQDSNTENSPSASEKQESNVMSAAESLNNEARESSSKEKEIESSEGGGGKRSGGGWLKRLLVGVLLVVNVPVALYTSLIHQRGTIDVMSFLYQQSYRGTRGTPVWSTPGQAQSGVLKGSSDNMSVLFLMPCHSTPYYSYLHRNITMRFLSCEPDLQQRTDYVDIADQFFLDPAGWLSANIFNQSYHSKSNLTANQQSFHNKSDESNQKLPSGNGFNQKPASGQHSSSQKSSHMNNANEAANQNTRHFHVGIPSAKQSQAFNPSANQSQAFISETEDYWLWDDTLQHCGHVTRTAALPSHVVLFEELFSRVGNMLRDVGYQICLRAFHTHFPEGRVSSHVLVLCR